MKDLHNKVTAVSAIAPAVKTAAETGAAIDLQGFGSAEIIVHTGAVAGAGDFGFKLQHADTTETADFVDVPAVDLLGTPPAGAMAATSAYKVGYVGARRYIRVVTLANGGTSLAFGAVAVLGDPHIAPVA